MMAWLGEFVVCCGFVIGIWQWDDMGWEFCYGTYVTPLRGFVELLWVGGQET